jgi:hypothetical protein
VLERGAFARKEGHSLEMAKRVSLRELKRGAFVREEGEYGEGGQDRVKE